jgi:ubiquinone biosynthesis protein
MARGAVPDSARGIDAISLFRRWGKVTAVIAYRSAKVGYHSVAGRTRHQPVDQVGSFPRQLRLALEELGPTFVKLGQLLSARSDIVSPEVRRELSKLEDHAPSIPHAKLVSEVERSLGSKTSTHFATLEMAPIACGSIAQVHRGTLHSGLRVAVKVRRPGVRDAIDADIWVLRNLARLVACLSSRVRTYDPVAILDQFAAFLRAETDFTTEADNLEGMRRSLAVSNVATIPSVQTELSGESVLVMDWIEGIPLSNRERLEEVGANRAGLARAILQAYGVMIFQSDRFHADPHPGNLIAMDGERLGLIDFGEVGSVEPAERSALLQMMAAVLSRDGEALAGAVLSVSRSTRTVDRAKFCVHLATLLLGPVVNGSLQEVRFGDILTRLLQIVRDYGIVLPSDLAVLTKTMIECEATTTELDPTMSILSLVGELGAFVPMPGATSFSQPSDQPETPSASSSRRGEPTDPPAR